MAFGSADSSQGNWNFTQALAGKTLGQIAGAVVARTSPQAAWPAAETPIEGVLERFHAEHHMDSAFTLQQPLTLAGFAKRLPVEVQSALRKPLKCDVVVHKAALAYGDAAQTTVLKQQVQMVSMILK